MSGKQCRSWSVTTSGLHNPTIDFSLQFYKISYYLHTCQIGHVTFTHICNCYVCVQLYTNVTYLLHNRICDICAFTAVLIGYAGNEDIKQSAYIRTVWSRLYTTCFVYIVTVYLSSWISRIYRAPVLVQTKKKKKKKKKKNILISSVLFMIFCLLDARVCQNVQFNPTNLKFC